jgi:DNA-binding transcriptional MocR family regulator
VESKPELSKYERIRQTLTEAIATGHYEPGQRLPSESGLVKTFGASRPTVNRALRDLQLSGIIERRALRQLCAPGRRRPRLHVRAADSGNGPAAEGPVTAMARSEGPVQRHPPATRFEAAAGGLSSGKG